MFPNDNAFLTEQYKAYRLQLMQLRMLVMEAKRIMMIWKKMKSQES